MQQRKNSNPWRNQWLKDQADNELRMQKLSEIERDYENKKENRDLLATTLKQAKLSDEKTAESAVSEDVSLLVQIQSVYRKALKSLKESNQITRKTGKFYLKNGEEKEAQLISLGTVAQFAENDGEIAALYPSGGGSFRVWKWLGADALSLSKGELPRTMRFFLYENPEKEFVAAKQKTTMDVIRSGGIIGWIILVMGIFAALISGVRFLLLQRAQGQNTEIVQNALNLIRDGEVEKAHHCLLKDNSAVSRVLNKTLSYLKSEPEKVEDAIMEAILKESQIIDRFGVVILVIASVAPLMGLLGTVTGMISTFDIITLYGTGNPKLLSGGISEALVTTMFGLIVAIPALLIGQFLGAKTERIKSDMEKWALAACNAFNSGKVS